VDSSRPDNTCFSSITAGGVLPLSRHRSRLHQLLFTFLQWIRLFQGERDLNLTYRFYQSELQLEIKPNKTERSVFFVFSCCLLFNLGYERCPLACCTTPLPHQSPVAGAAYTAYTAACYSPCAVDIREKIR
jgi:hypothetical protein